MDFSLKGSHLGLWDLGVIIIYFGIVLFVGLYTSRRNNKGTVSSYFLASRNMHWIPVGASLFASCIGSGHFIGLTGSGASAGVAVGGFELGAVLILMILGWCFTPVYMSSGVYTMPEYLKERFGGQRIQMYLSFLSLILYIFTKISAELYAGALFIQMALNKTSPEWLYLSILLLLLIAAVFTISGGLTAVMWTDFIQTILMIIGAVILAGITFYRVGGLNELIEDFPYAAASIQPNTSCGLPNNDYMNMFRTIEPGKSDFPWTGIVFGLTINAIWYWCTDQVIVQRALASKTLLHAKAGCILAGYIKILPFWILILPGMAARILFPDRVGCADPDECFEICGSRSGCTNIAYIELVLQLMPTGLAGMMLAVMLAALMSSLTSIFNSASTIFTIDVWTRIRKKPSESELLIVGRLFVVFLVIISVVWIPVIQNSTNSRLFDYIQSVTAFLAPPICAVFILAVSCARVNEPGAFWSLMIGLFIGMMRFVLEFGFPPPPCGSGIVDERSEIIKSLVDQIHYLHFSCILFAISVASCIAISLVTPPIPKESLHRLTFWTRFNKEVRVSICERKLKSKNVLEQNGDDQNGVELRHRKKVEANEKTLSEIEQHNETVDMNSTQMEEIQNIMDIVTEDPKWKNFVNMNAVICICLTVFIWSFFA